MKKILFLFTFLLLVSCNTQNTSNNSEMPSEKIEQPITQELPESWFENTENTKNHRLYTDILSKASIKLTKDPKFNECMATYTNVCLDEVANSLAQNANDMTICDELSDEESPHRSVCKFGMLARDFDKIRDIKQCDVIDDSYLKNVCKTHIVSMKASEAKDIKICEEVSEIFTDDTERMIDEKEGCMQGVLNLKEDIKLEDCDIFTTENMKTMCQESVKNPQ